MIYSQDEVLHYIEEQDVKFIKLTFCDGNGCMKNISIPASGMEMAFEQGVRITAKKIAGFDAADGRDVFLFPDVQTMTPLPWRSQQERVIRMFCFLRYADGTPFEADGRYFLKTAMKAAVSEGLRFRFGTACEFMLFRDDENGCPTRIPHDRAGYCDIAPKDRGENLRRDVCLTLGQMGIHTLCSHHEAGQGQHEIDFDSASALKAADMFLSFKSAVKSVAMQHGVHASFMPKPLPQECGNGMHITCTVQRSSHLEGGSADPEILRCAAAGIMRRIREITLFTNPIVNSYERLGSFSLPRTVTWSEKEGAQLFRLCDAAPEEGATLRAADCACNPYYVFGLMIYAALEGIRDGLSLPEENTGSAELPHDLGEAADVAQASQFLKAHLSPAVLERMLESRRMQWREYLNAQDQQAYQDQKFFEAL